MRAASTSPLALQLIIITTRRIQFVPTIRCQNKLTDPLNVVSASVINAGLSALSALVINLLL